MGLLPKEDRLPTEPRVPLDWVGYKAGISPGEWLYAGDLRFSPDPVAAGENFVHPVIDEQLPSIPDDTDGSIIIGDATTGQMFEVKMLESDLEKIGQIGLAAGYSRPSQKGLEPDSREDGAAMIEKSWSNGTDNRADLGVDGSGRDTWPYVVIGQLKGDGSGSMATQEIT